LIGKAFEYLLLSLLLFILAPIHAFIIGLQWGLEDDFSLGAFWHCIRKVFYDSDFHFREVFKKEAKTE
jgi:hypothetical protein